tara:strand:+ start:98 stop:466 length:369 start_codon:yes stop_codon:yes gene_type:complete
MIQALSSDIKNTLSTLCTFLDEQKAEDIISFNVEGHCSFTDGMIIASSRSQRHMKAMAEKLKERLHHMGIKNVHIEGATSCDWVLIDGDCVVVHLFRQDIREYYNLEKIWNKDYLVESITSS